MDKINKKLHVMGLALLLAVAGGLNAELRLIESPQRQASADQFWSDPDLFISVTGYKDVEFNNWFGFVSFVPFGGNTTDMVQFGFAAQFGGLYTALCYGGNMFRLGKYEYDDRGWDFIDGTRKTMKTFGSLDSINQASNIYNELALLFGFANMGVRLSLVSTYLTRSINENFTLGGLTPVFYKDFTDERGRLNPQFAWGMARDIIPGKGIKPHLYLDFDFGRDYQKFAEYDTVTGEAIEKIGRSENNFSFDLTVAMGYLSLLNRGNFDLGIDVWYSLDLTTYDNEYNYLDSDGNNKIGNGYKGRYTPGDSFIELSEINHSLIPFLSASWGNEKISFSAEFGLDFGLGFSGKSNMELALNNSGKLERHGDDSSSVELYINPLLNLGLKWAIIQDKFFLNAGCVIDFGSPTITTTTSVEYDRGSKKDEPERKSGVYDFKTASTRVSLGVTYLPFTFFGLQAMCGVGTNNDLNVFSPVSANGGIFVFSQILATVRF